MSPLARIRWWQLYLAGSLLLLLDSALYYYVPAGPFRDRILRSLHLGAEMNPSVWWSGMALFAAGLLAGEAGRRGARRVRSAWFTLSGFCALLACDEIGSFHERSSSWRSVQMAVVAAVVGFVLYRLWSDRETRRAAFAVAVALSLYGFVVIQERLEHVIADWPHWALGPRVALEEGSELLGTLFLLYAAVRHAGRRAGGTRIGRIVPDLSRRGSLLPLLAAGFVAHLAITAWWLPTLHDLRVRGNPSALFPSLCFFVLAVACHGHRARAAGRGRAAWGLLGLLCLASSLGAVFNLARPFAGLPLARLAVVPFLPLALQVLAATAILAWGRLLRGVPRPWAPLAVALLAAAAIAAGADHRAVLPGALALLLAGLTIVPERARLGRPDARPVDLATDPLRVA